MAIVRKRDIAEKLRAVLRDSNAYFGDIRAKVPRVPSADRAVLGPERGFWGGYTILAPSG
jgi:hypothetical protein